MIGYRVSLRVLGSCCFMLSAAGCQAASLNKLGGGGATTSTGYIPSAGQTQASPGTQATDAKLSEVQAEVAANNAMEAADKNAFNQSGWVFLDNVAAPDEQVLRFDPALLDGRENELRAQLASTTPKAIDIPNISQIIRTSQNPDLRFTAIEALGHINDEQAGVALLALLTDSVFADGDPNAALVSSLLQPSDLDTALGESMVRALDHSGLSLIVKRQIATNLAVLSLRDEHAVRGLSPFGRTLLNDALAILRH